MEINLREFQPVGGVPAPNLVKSPVTLIINSSSLYNLGKPSLLSTDELAAIINVTPEEK
jgi:hypothetical protein